MVYCLGTFISEGPIALPQLNGNKSFAEFQNMDSCVYVKGLS